MSFMLFIILDLIYSRYFKDLNSRRNFAVSPIAVDIHLGKFHVSSYYTTDCT